MYSNEIKLANVYLFHYILTRIIIRIKKKEEFNFNEFLICSKCSFRKDKKINKIKKKEEEKLVREHKIEIINNEKNKKKNIKIEKDFC